ncbi:MAG: DUF4157 domain-containing protein [Desulfobacterales bacterium]
MIRLAQRQRRRQHRQSANATQPDHADNRHDRYWNFFRTRQPTWGNQTLQRLLRARAIQAKLKVSKPDDGYEREADRLSEQVVRQYPKTEQARLSSASPPMTTLGNSAVPGTGTPLPAAQRAFFETRLGDDFGSVRIHTQPQSAHLARELHARAFTMGNDIVFDQDQYAPQTREGRRLLAHELVHVRQQRHGISGRESLSLGFEMIQREPQDQPSTASAAGSPCPDLGDIPAIPIDKEMLKEQKDLHFKFPRLEGKCFWTIRGGSDNCCGYCLFRASGGDLSGKGSDVAIPPTIAECDLLFAPFYDPIESAAVDAGHPPGDALLALYAEGEHPTHVACRSDIQYAGKHIWESKLSNVLPLILHHLEDLEGGPDGDVVRFYKKKSPSSTE